MADPLTVSGKWIPVLTVSLHVLSQKQNAAVLNEQINIVISARLFPWTTWMTTILNMIFPCV